MKRISRVFTRLSSHHKSQLAAALPLTVMMVTTAAVYEYKLSGDPQNHVEASLSSEVVEEVPEAAAPVAEVQTDSGTTVNTSVSGNASASHSRTVEVKVNDQTVPVPENGSVQKTITTPDGQTQVNISNNGSNTSVTGSSSSNTFVSTHSNSFQYSSNQVSQ